MTGIVALLMTGSAATFGQTLQQNDNEVAESTPPAKSGFSYNNANTSKVSVDFEQAATAAVPSVVHIRTLIKAGSTPADGQQENSSDEDNTQPDQRASGSGVIIRSDGYIVTNNHVVDHASKIVVTLNNRKDYDATVVGTDPNTDLAVIKIEGDNLPVMNIGNSDNARLGQWVLAIGYPLNLDVTVTEGIISAKSRSIGINQAAAPIESFIQTDAAVNPGSSGGALINTNGELIGINAAIASPTGSYAGYAYSIPSNLMVKVVSDIIKFGAVQRAYLGISMAPEEMGADQKKELGIDDNINAVWIVAVTPNSAADVAGLQKGDAITKINGVSVSTGAQLSEQIGRQKPGDEIEITYLRSGTEQSANVTLQNTMGSLPG